ncbi:MAG: hypothetical protein RSC28_08980 [Bacteroidales bacterium]
MANTEIKGKVITVEQPAHLLYTGFTNMKNFIMALPPDKREGIIATEDTIEGNVKGFNMGLRIAERSPFSSIVYEHFGNAPFPFTISIYFNAVDIRRTEFHMEIAAELNFMIKSMIGDKLNKVVDQLTDQLALAFSGKIDPNNISNITYN